MTGWAIYTIDGVKVFEPKGEGNPPLTEEQAEASVRERDARAIEMDLKVRYEAREA